MGAYGAVGISWIIVSDVIVPWAIADPEEAGAFDVALGWMFVILSAVFLFAVLRVVGRESAARASAERDLASERAFLSSVVLQAPVAVVAFDVDARLMLWNPAAEAMFGWRKEEVLGEPPRFFAEAEQAEVLATREAILDGATFQVDRYAAIRKDGSSLVVSGSAGPLSDQHGEFVGILALMTDVTEVVETERVRDEALRDLEDSERRYRALFAESPSPTWVFDEDTLRFLAVNRAAVDEYGYRDDEFLAMTIADVRPVEEVPVLAEELAVATEAVAGEAWLPVSVGPMIHRRKDGSVLFVIGRGVRIRWEGRDAWLIVLSDVTAQVEADRAATEHAAELLRYLGFMQAVVGAPDTRRLGASIAEHTRRVVAGDEFGVVVHEGGESRLVVASPEVPGFAVPTELVGETLMAKDVAVRWDDLAAAPPSGLRDRALAAGARSILAVPLRAGGDVFAHAYVVGHGEAAFDAGAQARLEDFQEELSLGVQHLVVQERLERRTAQLEVLGRLDRAFVGADSTPEVASGVATIVREALGADLCTVSFVEGDALVCGGADGAGHERFVGVRTPLAAVTPALEQVQRVLDLDLLPPMPELESWRGEGIRSVVTVPVRVGEELIGLVGAESFVPYRFSRADEELLSAIQEDLGLGFRHAFAQRALAERGDHLARLSEERRRLLQSVVDAQEHERTRIARELHDSLGQTLTSLGLFMYGLERESADEDRPRIEGFRHRVEDAVRQTRTIVADLRPVELDSGLGPAIATMVAGATEGIVEASVVTDLGERRFDPALEAAVFRVVQEAVANALAHAAPTSIAVIGGVREHTLLVVVEDRGSGFDQDAVTGDGFGLVSMRERAGAVGGTLTVESALGQGTVVRLEVPVP